MILDRLSIRAKLAAGFAAALLVVLTLAAAFVYLRVSSDLKNALDDALESRANDLATLLDAGGGRPARIGGGPVSQVNVQEGFSQILSPDGTVVATTLKPGAGPALGPDQIDEAAGEELIVELDVPGVEGTARVLGRPATSAGRPFIVVVGNSTDDRREALDGLIGAFAIGAPLALLLAAGLGYFLAGRSLAPVAAMRRRANEITLERGGERLPLPRAEDEIHHLGETLNAMLDRLEAGLARERVFVADASHELRTPLAILSAELELADSPERSPEDLRRAVRSASEEIDRLSQLAEDLLVMARLDQGRLPIAREPVQLRTLLERVRERFNRRAKAGDRRITVDAPESEIADLDPYRIEQALGNLVDNALRHGGGDVRLSAWRRDGFVVLEVADKGPGFPAGFEDDAFQRFTRGDPGRSGGGAGLGLAIVQAIAVAHRGQVSMANGSGDASTTTLQLTLPVQAPPDDQ